MPSPVVRVYTFKCIMLVLCGCVSAISSCSCWALVQVRVSTVPSLVKPSSSHELLTQSLSLPDAFSDIANGPTCLLCASFARQQQQTFPRPLPIVECRHTRSGDVSTSTEKIEVVDRTTLRSLPDALATDLAIRSGLTDIH